MRLSRFWVFALFLAAFCGVQTPIWAQNPVTWTAKAPADVRAGEIGKIELNAKIESPWHIYAPTTPDGGPVATKIEIADNPNVKIAGKIEQDKPKSKMDAGFGIMVEVYGEKANFKIPVQFSKTASKTIGATIKVRFQACNERLCLPPKTVEIPLVLPVAQGAARPDRAKIAPATSTSTSETPKTAPKPTQNSAPIVKKNASSGLLGLIGAAFIGGFLALFTPCVFPMVPITVSLFTKKEGDAKPTLAGPIAYCLGIISTFTALGVAVSLIFGASGIKLLAANPWINLALAALFIVLALNLFGVYEIFVPSALVNRVQPKGKEGLVAPFLMGFAFTLTSFTCTVPFVGTTLVSTATQGPIYPAIGMLCFSTAFALPFFLLALFPQFLQKLPRSGEWLISVKAFMGFLELAAALKFLQTADYVWNLQILTRPVFLAIWFAIALIAGAYLLRFLRLPNDSPNQKIGPFRLALGAATIGVAFWLLSANNGVSLRDLDAFPPPEKYGKANQKDDVWLVNDLKAAQNRAKLEGKPLLINFTGYACTNCRVMEKNVLPEKVVTDELNSFVTVELFTDADNAMSREFSDFQQKKFGTIAIPMYAVVTPDGQITGQLEGLERDPQKFADFLTQARQVKSAGVQTRAAGNA